MSEAPESIRSAIAELWRTSAHTEDAAFRSGAFRLLEINCGSTYSGIEGSRLAQQATSGSMPKELQSALQNFFRWNGAPWYDGPSPDEGETALRLHQAFLGTEVNRIYFAPLDRLDLEDPTQRPRQSLEHVRFGLNEIVLLKSTDLAHRVGADALQRFDRWYWFPNERLDDLYWLIVSTREKAGPIWERTWRAVLHRVWSEFDHFPIFEPTYPGPVEDALFVLLLSLFKQPSETRWKPFAVPWTYSLTSDLFADPSRAPDPTALTWRPAGPPDAQFEVADRSEVFEITPSQLETALGQRWRRLQAASARSDTEQANFHPLTKHFFVKALAEEGIDEIVANISCIEAMLQLPEEKNRTKLMSRYKRLVDDGNAHQWLDDAYNLRNRYLHSLGGASETMSWKDLARTRWSITRAVDNYLALTEERSNLNRAGMLSCLEG